jgi:flavin-dependent dehydrogenase
MSGKQVIVVGSGDAGMAAAASAALAGASVTVLESQSTDDLPPLHCRQRVREPVWLRIPGPGATVGTAVVFSWRAGRTAADA